MSIKTLMRFPLILTLITCFILSAHALESATDPTSTSLDSGIKALNDATESGKHLLVLFQPSNKLTTLTDSFISASQKLIKTADSVVINTKKVEESGLVDRYNIRFAPLPIVVILAPNGALTGSFTKSFSKDQVENLILSPASQQCLLALQKKKLVFICIQGNETDQNEEAMEGVEQFRKTNVFGNMTEVIVVDPADPLESKLLSQLRLKTDIKVANTLLLSPPGKVLGKWSGATSKGEFTLALMAESKAGKTCSVPNCGDPTCETPKASSAKGGTE
ncbi:MAG: hypothetical protein GY860_04915 [Desulfobacteraceae bacterium]|nr:hypothetical protein [Desulfobacteraceae bacterium]